MKEVEKCPICGHSEKKEVFKAPFFRGEKVFFAIQECLECKFWYTSPRPEDEDLGKYYEQENYVSHSDKGKSLFDIAYRNVRKIALKSKVSLVQKYTERKALVLDYGAGGGAFVKALLEAKFNAQGVEPSEVARLNAKSVYGLSLHQADYIESSNAKFEAITMWHVLEHLPNLHQHLETFANALSSKGVLIIAVPNHESLDAQYYLENWAALDVPLHLYHFKKANIRQLAKMHNFEVCEIKNMPFDSFYVSMLSEKIAGSNSNINALITGLKSNMKAGQDNASSLIYVLRKLS